LVTSYRYATDGESDASIDPMGVEWSDRSGSSMDGGEAGARRVSRAMPCPASQTRWEKDAAGRRTLLIENYDPDEPARDYGANRTTAFHYTLGGQLATLTLRNRVTGDQVTRFVYGTTTSDSKVARNDLLRAKIYPESDDSHDPLGDGPDGVYSRGDWREPETDAAKRHPEGEGAVRRRPSQPIEYAYDRTGAVTEMTDPNETVHAYDYDSRGDWREPRQMPRSGTRRAQAPGGGGCVNLGRLLHDRVTAFGSGIDQGVKRISTTYDNRGLPETVTSYDDATVGGGSALNEVEHTYDDFQQLKTDKQEHAGAVDASTPGVAYAYADGSGANTARRTSVTYPDGHIVSQLLDFLLLNTARRTSVTYPDGRVVELDYGASGAENDLLSRLASLKINGETDNLAEYEYVGRGGVVKVAHPEPEVDLTYIKAADQPVEDAGDPYTGFDRFGRTVNMRWMISSGDTIRDGFTYGYDRSSQRTWKHNPAASAGDGQDEAYRYDGLYQVTAANRGELNKNHTAIGGIPAKAERFDYDPTGNWLGYVEKSDGVTDLDQTRKNNKDNQITQFDGSSDGVEHDKAGNATAMHPDASGDWSSYVQLTWDAWNRLVEVADDGGTIIATYEYDGTTRRITVTAGGTTTYTYYNEAWKAIEEREGASTDPERQWVWEPLDRNALILRDRDTTGDGSFDERLYATRDAMGSVTALLDTGGTVQERYGYTAFGKRRVMDEEFVSRASSNYDWRLGFHGEFLDTDTGYVNYGFRYCAPSEAWHYWQGESPCRENPKGGSPEEQVLTRHPYRVLRA